MICDERNMFKATFHKHDIQPLEQSHEPQKNNKSFITLLGGKNTSSTQNAPNPSVIDVERDNTCKQRYCFAVWIY